MLKRITIILGVIFIIISCNQGSDKKQGKDLQQEASEKITPDKLIEEVNIDLKQIKERGVLRAITIYSSTSFFIYRGKPLGYEYELIKRLADHLGLELEIVIAENMNKLFEMLYKGEGDIISYGITITKDRLEDVSFTKYHTKTHQVLVQRKPKNWRQMKLHEIEEMLIRDPLDLIGKKVHVRENSSYYQRLLNLSDEIGGEIDIETVPGSMETEDLIKQVAEGKIRYTISDENIARINKTYYANLDIETAVSFNQRVAWAVRQSSPELLKAVNTWIGRMRKKTDYYVIYNKYFKNRKAYKSRVKSEFFSRKGNRISEFDPIIKQYAKEIGWDWRLLASLIYQESKWDPATESWAGALGLMQIMPFHVEACGIKDYTDPEQNIRCGSRYIEDLKSYYEEIDDEQEQLKFILASYNAGPNHVKDAQRLAEKYGDDPEKWTGSVDEYILKKADPDYYNDEVVKYGYCRGTEPYDYVKEILERYEYYRQFIGEK
ncbi:MAG: transporter substrate-binding domain-containing protein [Bacteroidales bacterium]|nr:transporter substrate-binding domain-containing protein [Bacteroidales bacterium]MCF8398106.1 transporter substrate-binding domain-containing protein [Bacteroidales bacterium]